MPNRNVLVLNEVTESLIDSQKGYQNCSAIAKDYMPGDSPIRSEFEQRAQQREQLVNKFQQQVREYGETPIDHGTAKGAIQRDFGKFTSLFKDNAKAALSAVDKGEEHLAHKIENQLSKYEKDLSQPTRHLLEQAHQAAMSGERFAEMAIQRRA